MHRSSVDFPEPGRADQDDDLVFGDVEVDAVEHGSIVVGLDQAAHRQHRRDVGSSLAPP